MNHKELTLAAEFLERCSEELGNNGCDDWDYPDDWTEEEKRTFCREINEWNNSPEEYDPDDLSLPDWFVADFLAHKLSILADHEKKMDEVDYKENEHD